MSTAESKKIVITIPGVKELLNQGKSRKEIAEHFGVPMSVMKEKVWSHPELKNLKAKKQYDIELLGEEPATEVAKEEVQAEVTQTVEETVQVNPISEVPSDVAQAETTGHDWSRNGTTTHQG